MTPLARVASVPLGYCRPSPAAVYDELCIDEPASFGLVLAYIFDLTIADPTKLIT